MRLPLSSSLTRLKMNDSDDLLASSDTGRNQSFDANEPVIKYKIQLKAEGNVGYEIR